VSGSEPPRGGTLVFVYGPPASGKLTVAQEIATRTGFRLLHNHATIDAVSPLFEWGTPQFFKLVGRFRLALVGAAAEEGLDVVLTFAYAPPHDDEAVAEYVDLYERQGGRVLFVQLEAPDEELLRRVGSPSRGEHGKLTDADALRDVINRYDFRTPVPFEPNLTVDTTLVDPSEAAAQIVEHYGLGSPT
jgi:hypothetical protein